LARGDFRLQLTGMRTNTSHTLALLIGFVTPGLALSQPLDLSRYRVIDLTHPQGRQTLYWPNSPSAFKLDTLAFGMTPGGFFYSSFAFSTPEHGGTHIDAPIHFAEGGNTTDRIPLSQLIASVVVIDVTLQAGADRDYRATADDVLQFEARYGRIASGTIVLLRTGWDKRWSDRLRYFGDDMAGRTTHLHFPGFSAEAARLLVEQRRVAALGIDAASIDYGPSQDFIVHRIAMRANVPAFENLMNLDQLPARGATLIALPMKIEGGSGGPLRAVALVPR
jgi:kynurenine formamidase